MPHEFCPSIPDLETISIPTARISTSPLRATSRVEAFLRDADYDGPRLVVDLDVVRQRYSAYVHAMPGTRIYYAVKANPAPEVLQILADLGSCFDTASIPEIEAVLALGVAPDRISFGNTIKKEVDISRAHAMGVRLFAFDSDAELEKIVRSAPGAQVFCRVRCDGTGADWPLSRKFGCSTRTAVELLLEAHRKGLDVQGVSFHVGSQQRRAEAWDVALATVADVYRTLCERGLKMPVINMGGGFPAAQYREEVPPIDDYAASIDHALRRHFDWTLPEAIIEPGRGLVADAGVIEAEVVLIARKDQSGPRWVYLDIGRFGGLAETEDEAIRYVIRTPKDGDDLAPAILAGPTCDSIDVLYEKEPYWLPVSLEIGDRVRIEAAGAYTASYSSVGFNGFAPLQSYFV
ncbi:type III PLP-dependent enzyme [Nocardia sp. NPDC049220]|uniref:type III PLP-dependent enzyme n=1 Tax=Nocardia sp. NPDC049220 TaxID=3155273 RepID=UPI0033E0B106